MKGLGLTAAIFVISVTESGHSVAAEYVSVTLKVDILYQNEQGQRTKDFGLVPFPLDRVEVSD